jgi:hypothetical protein
MVLSFLQAFAILFAAGMVILVVSMIGTRKAMGGSEFGSLFQALLKGGGLVFVNSLISLIPDVGIWLTLPVWWIGFMILFRIDFWEARILVIINFVLNLVFKLFLLGFLLRDAEIPRDVPPKKTGGNKVELPIDHLRQTVLWNQT